MDSPGHAAFIVPLLISIVVFADRPSAIQSVLHPARQATDGKRQQDGGQL